MTNKTAMKYEIKANTIMYYGMNPSKPKPEVIEMELDGKIDRMVIEYSINKAIKRYPYFAVLLLKKPYRLVLDEKTNKIRLHDSMQHVYINEERFELKFS